MEDSKLKLLKEIAELKEDNSSLLRRNTILEARIQQQREKAVMSKEFMGTLYRIMIFMFWLSRNYNPNVAMRAKFFITENKELREKHGLKPFRDKYENKDKDGV